MTDEIKELEAKLKQLRDEHYQEITKQENQQLQSYVGRYFILGTVDIELIKVTGVNGGHAEVMYAVKNIGVYTGRCNKFYFENIVEITEEAFNKVLSETLCYLNPNQPQEVEVWASMNGEYSCFHEISINVIYDVTNELVVDKTNDVFAESVKEGLEFLEEFDSGDNDFIDYKKLKALKVGDKYYLEL